MSCISTTLWIFKTKPWHKGLMTSEDIEDPKQQVFSFYSYSPSTVFIFIDTISFFIFEFSLQKTLKSVFLPRYESLKLNHDTNYLMTSEDTVEDPLRSVQFYLKGKFFHFVLQSIYCFHFHCKRRLNCISTKLWIFKTKQWHKLFDDIWRHGWRSVDECSILFKQQEFFHFVLQSIYCFHFHCKRRLNCISTALWIFKTKPWTIWWHWRHGWRSVDVQFYIKDGRVFFISYYSPSTLFFFYCNRLFNLYFYNAMNLQNFITRTIWWHLKTRLKIRWWVFNFIKIFFHFVLQSIYCFHFYCKRRLNLYFYHAMNL